MKMKSLLATLLLALATSAMAQAKRPNPALRRKHRRRRPRDCRSSLECCLHDRPWSKRTRRADVDLWQLRRSRAIQECVLTSNGKSSAAPDFAPTNQTLINPTKPLFNGLARRAVLDLTPGTRATFSNWRASYGRQSRRLRVPSPLTQAGGVVRPFARRAILRTFRFSPGSG
jgi:hypothetical protein